MWRTAIMLWLLCATFFVAALFLAEKNKSTIAYGVDGYVGYAYNDPIRSHLQKVFRQAADETEGLDYYASSKKINANTELLQSLSHVRREDRPDTYRPLSFMSTFFQGPPAGDFMFPVSEALRIQNHVKRDGNVAISIDQKMHYGEEYAVTVAIQGTGEADPETKKLRVIQDSFPAPTVFSERIEYTGASLRAHITAAGMSIEETKGGWQGVEDTSVSIWTWNVVPTSSGKKTVFIYLDQKTDDYVFPVNTYPRLVEIVITPEKRFALAYDWARVNLGALAIGLSTLAGSLASAATFAEWRRKRKETQESKMLLSALAALDEKVSTSLVPRAHTPSRKNRSKTPGHRGNSQK